MRVILLPSIRDAHHDFVFPQVLYLLSVYLPSLQLKIFIMWSIPLAKLEISSLYYKAGQVSYALFSYPITPQDN